MQLQCVSLRMEIPGLSNNTTENLKQKKIVEPGGLALQIGRGRRGAVMVFILDHKRCWGKTDNNNENRIFLR